jgi:hypothetical protein
VKMGLQAYMLVCRDNRTKFMTFKYEIIQRAFRVSIQ